MQMKIAKEMSYKRRLEVELATSNGRPAHKAASKECRTDYDSTFFLPPTPPAR
jgi:hypothetical protein